MTSSSASPFTPAVEARVEAILAQLTLAELVALNHSGSKFAVAAIPRVGIPEWTMSDGPHGVRREIQRDSWDFVEGFDDEATYLPTGTALAATWNPEMARLHGEVLGSEARERGKDIILGPGINLVRTPVCGRNFEYYSEDPYLIAELVVPAVQGIQSQGVAACVKHFACNNQELDRNGVDARIDERTLRELYLPGFEAAVIRGHAMTVMGAYNLVRGQHACHHEHLINRVLKGEWKFQGSVISDWGGTYSTFQAARFGLDVEMGSGEKWDAYHLAAPFFKAINDGLLDPALARDKARRNLRVMVATGVLDPAGRPRGERNTKRHQAAARRIAQEAVVLLRNEGGVLPLAKTIRKLLVVGDNATVQHHAGGFSSGLRALYEVTPLEGLRAAFGEGVVTHIRGYPDAEAGGDLDPNQLSIADAKAGTRGWTLTYHDHPWAPTPALATVAVEKVAVDWRSGRPYPFLKGRECSARFTTVFTPTVGGRYRFVLHGANRAYFSVDGKQAILCWEIEGPDVVSADVDLVAGTPVTLYVHFRPQADEARNVMRLGVISPGEGADATGRAALLDAARAADAVVFVGGLSHQDDTEGGDRRDIGLRDGQDELIAALAGANPRFVVALVGGSPMAMPWIERVPAVVMAWYGGAEGGHALADVLTGAVNPGGKLPMTFPKRLADSPAHALDDYRAGVCEYREGVFTGYRWFDARAIAPLFCFGHGLSYTTFAYSDIAVRQVGEAVEVSCMVTNTGARAGAEVVQCYVGDDQASVARPPRELKAFRKLTLAPGVGARVVLTLDRRAFAFWDERHDGWTAEPGRFTIAVGSSSRDLRLTIGVDVT
jgi:beta-glucosidase